MNHPGAAVVGTTTALPCASPSISIARCVADASDAAAILRHDGRERTVFGFQKPYLRIAVGC